MRQTHTHIDDLQAMLCGELATEGKLDVILACDTCRQKVFQVLEMTLPDDAGMDQIGQVKRTQNQMEMNAFIFKTEIDRLLKEGHGILTPESRRYLKKIFDARKVIGEEGNWVIDEARMTPIEIPISLEEEF